MNKIEKLHLDAIKNCKNEVAFNVFGTMIYIVDENLAPTEASKVTEQIAIEFAEWLIKELILSSHGKYLSHTPKELFQEFLKTKQ